MLIVNTNTLLFVLLRLPKAEQVNKYAFHSQLATTEEEQGGATDPDPSSSEDH